MQNSKGNKIAKRRMERLKRRSYSVEQHQKRKERRDNETEREASNLSQFRGILQNQKKAEKETPKHLSSEIFLSAFAFLPIDWINREHAMEGCNAWKSRSFNERRQYMEFFRTFVYPYRVPEPLVLTAIQEDLYDGANGMLRYSQDFDIIHKTRKWLEYKRFPA